MKRNYITYAQSGVGGAYESKAEKIDMISTASVTTSKDEYLIGGIGGFAGMFDFGRFIEERNFKRFVREIFKKYGEKRAPYVLAGYWLQNRLNLQKLRTRQKWKK